MLERALLEKTAQARERRIEAVVDFMAGQMVLPSAIDREMAQRLAKRHARVLNEFGLFHGRATGRRQPLAGRQPHALGGQLAQAPPGLRRAASGQVRARARRLPRLPVRGPQADQGGAGRARSLRRSPGALEARVVVHLEQRLVARQCAARRPAGIEPAGRGRGRAARCAKKSRLELPRAGTASRPPFRSLAGRRADPRHPRHGLRARELQPRRRQRWRFAQAHAIRAHP